MKSLLICTECGCYIDPKLGEFSPADYSHRIGTKEEPKSPGENRDNICDECYYGKGLR